MACIFHFCAFVPIQALLANFLCLLPKKRNKHHMVRLVLVTEAVGNYLIQQEVRLLRVYVCPTNLPSVSCNCCCGICLIQLVVAFDCALIDCVNWLCFSLPIFEKEKQTPHGSTGPCFRGSWKLFNSTES